MKKKIIFISWSAAVIVLLLFIYCIFVYVAWGPSPIHTYKIKIDSNTPLTEELVIKMSRNALEESGMDADKMVPVPFTNDDVADSFFSINSIDPNNGYIMWGGIDGKIYTIDILRHDNYVECSIYKQH